jgi:hypothetical protein
MQIQNAQISRRSHQKPNSRFPGKTPGDRFIPSNPISSTKASTLKSGTGYQNY